MTKKQIYLELQPDLAAALAQLCKRIGWDALRDISKDDDEAYEMRDGVAQLASALQQAGFAPR